jgi:S-adenosylmethionine synthetase
MIDAHDTEKVDLEKLRKAVLKVFDFRPAAIIDRLNLKRPIYRQTAAYGHFGRIDIRLPWEETDAVDQLKKAVD